MQSWLDVMAFILCTTYLIWNIGRHIVWEIVRDEILSRRKVVNGEYL